MLKLEISGKRTEDINKKVWTSWWHFLFVSKFGIKSHASITGFQKLRNPPGYPWHYYAAPSPLLHHSPCYFWAAFCVCFPRCHLCSQHTCGIFRGKQGKQRKRGWVQGTKVTCAKRKPNRDIWSSSWKKQNSPSHVNVCECWGHIWSNVFLRALQIILWFLQTSFWVMAFKHHLSPSQFSSWKVMYYQYQFHPRNEYRDMLICRWIPARLDSVSTAWISCKFQGEKTD